VQAPVPNQRHLQAGNHHVLFPALPVRVTHPPSFNLDYSCLSLPRGVCLGEPPSIAFALHSILRSIRFVL
jgi:hypothetical protein